MFLNSFQQQVIVPIPDKFPDFYQCVLESEERTILDANGNKVRTENVDVPRLKKLTTKDFVLDGITTDLFDVETSQKVGQNLQVMTGSFFGVSLDDRSDVEAQINSTLDSIENQISQSQNNSDSIKFD